MERILRVTPKNPRPPEFLHPAYRFKGDIERSFPYPSNKVKLLCLYLVYNCKVKIEIR